MIISFAYNFFCYLKIFIIKNFLIDENMNIILFYNFYKTIKEDWSFIEILIIVFLREFRAIKTILYQSELVHKLYEFKIY